MKNAFCISLILVSFVVFSHPAHGGKKGGKARRALQRSQLVEQAKAKMDQRIKLHAEQSLKLRQSSEIQQVPETQQAPELRQSAKAQQAPETPQLQKLRQSPEVQLLSSSSERLNVALRISRKTGELLEGPRTSRISSLRILNEKAKSISEESETPEQFVFEEEHQNFQVLIDSLRENLSLKKLHISNSKMNEEKGRAFAAALRENESIEALVFEKVQFDKESSRVILESILSNKNIKELHFLDNKMDADAFQDFAKVLGNDTHLKKLILYKNAIPYEKLITLGGAIGQNRSLVYLELRGIHFNPDAYRAFAYGLRNNSTLEELHLLQIRRKNKEGRSTRILYQVVRPLESKPALKTLWLCGNEIKDDEAISILNTLKSNKQLQTLRLDHNHIASGTLEDLIQNRGHLNLSLFGNRDTTGVAAKYPEFFKETDCFGSI